MGLWNQTLNADNTLTTSGNGDLVNKTVATELMFGLDGYSGTPTAFNRIFFLSDDAAGTANDPTWTFTYTVPGGASLRRRNVLAALIGR